MASSSGLVPSWLATGLSGSKSSSTASRRPTTNNPVQQQQQQELSSSSSSHNLDPHRNRGLASLAPSSNRLGKIGLGAQKSPPDGMGRPGLHHHDPYHHGGHHHGGSGGHGERPQLLLTKPGQHHQQYNNNTMNSMNSNNTTNNTNTTTTTNLTSSNKSSNSVSSNSATSPSPSNSADGGGSGSTPSIVNDFPALLPTGAPRRANSTPNGSAWKTGGAGQPKADGAGGKPKLKMVNKAISQFPRGAAIVRTPSATSRQFSLSKQQPNSASVTPHSSPPATSAGHSPKAVIGTSPIIGTSPTSSASSSGAAGGNTGTASSGSTQGEDAFTAMTDFRRPKALGLAAKKDSTPNATTTSPVASKSDQGSSPIHSPKSDSSSPQHTAARDFSSLRQPLNKPPGVTLLSNNNSNDNFTRPGIGGGNSSQQTSPTSSTQSDSIRSSGGPSAVNNKPRTASSSSSSGPPRLSLSKGISKSKTNSIADVGFMDDVLNAQVPPSATKSAPIAIPQSGNKGRNRQDEVDNIGVPSSLEAEERLLRAMGWEMGANDQLEEEEEGLTEAEIAAFLSEQKADRKKTTAMRGPASIPSFQQQPIPWMGSGKESGDDSSDDSSSDSDDD